MAIRIHHAVIKQAAKLGITLTKGDMDVSASKDGQTASAPNATLAIAALLKKLGTTTVDLMTTLKPKPVKAPKAAKPRKAKKSKFTCVNCGHTKTVQGDDGLECAECGEAAEDDGEGRSLVKRKYKQAYKPHKSKCGDEISKQVTAHTTMKGEDGKSCMDVEKLIRFAKANGVWDPNYVKVNNGMKRMNTVNRLRGKVRRDKHEIVWAK